MLELTDKTFDQEVIKSPEPIVVDLWAPWCGPCKMLAPVLDELAKEFTGKVRFAKLNTDENIEAPTRFKVFAIPTLLFFKDGKVQGELVGVQSKEQIRKKLASILPAEDGQAPQE